MDLHSNPVAITINIVDTMLEGYLYDKRIIQLLRNASNLEGGHLDLFGFASFHVEGHCHGAFTREWWRASKTAKFALL